MPTPKNIGTYRFADGNDGHPDHINHKNMLSLENDTGGDMVTGDVGIFDADGKVSTNTTVSALKQIVVVPPNVTGADVQAAQTYSNTEENFWQFSGLAKDVQYDDATTAGNFVTLSATADKLTDTGVDSRGDTPPLGTVGIVMETLGAAGQADTYLYGSTVGGAKLKRTSAVDPAVTDDVDLGYSTGSLWINTTLDRAYVCLDATDGAAVWQELRPSTDLLFNSDQVDVLNTVTETNIFSEVLPANSLYVASTDQSLIITIVGYNNDTTTGDPVFKLKLGSTTLLTLTSQPFTADAAFRLEMMLAGDGATNVQKAAGTLFHQEEAADEQSHFLIDTGSAAEDSTGALTLAVTVTNGSAEAGNGVNIYWTEVRGPLRNTT